MGVTNPEGHAGCHLKLDGQDSIEIQLRKHLEKIYPDGTWQVDEMRLAPGEYYPRIVRPSDQHPLDGAGHHPAYWEYRNELAVMRGQVVNLTRSLDRIFQYVHPDVSNYEVYSHEIRNLLILACTEVESHWRGVMVANGCKQSKFSTKDYVKLCNAMKLPDYAISFEKYPWLPDSRPFVSWGITAKSSQDIPWYSAYNDVKHDREAQFSKSTLSIVMDAVSACMIMLCAQFGKPDAFNNDPDLLGFYRMSEVPVWDYRDVYTYPYVGGHLAVNFPF